MITPGRYVAIPFWLRLIPNSLLRPSAKLVWATIANHLCENAESFPSIERIALEAGSSVPAVSRDLKTLEAFGLLIRRRTRTANHYTLQAPTTLLEAETWFQDQREQADEGNDKAFRVRYAAELRARLSEFVKAWLSEFVNPRVSELVKSRTRSLANLRLSESVKPGLSELVKPRLSESVKAEVSELVKPRLSESVKGTTKKELPQEEPPQRNNSKGTTSLSPAPQERKREQSIAGDSSSRETSSQPNRKQAKPPASKKNSDQGITLTQESGKRRFAQLTTLWKKEIGEPGDIGHLKACLQRMLIQEKSLGVRIDPEKVIASVKKSDLGLEFNELWQKSGSAFVWYKLLRGKKPGKSRRTQFKDEEIEAVYEAYPRHIKKIEALKEIRAALNLLKKNRPDLPLEDHLAFLLEKTRTFAKSGAGQRGRFTPYPSTWFRNGQYLDDEQEWNTAQNRSGNIQRTVEEDTVEEPGDSVDVLLDSDISL
jgi:biotin operon repressor